MIDRSQLTPEMNDAIADYVRVAPNAHLGDNTPAEDRAAAETLIFSHPHGIAAGVRSLNDITSSMEDM